MFMGSASSRKQWRGRWEWGREGGRLVIKGYVLSCLQLLWVIVFSGCVSHHFFSYCQAHHFSMEVWVHSPPEPVNNFSISVSAFHFPFSYTLRIFGYLSPRFWLSGDSVFPNETSKGLQSVPQAEGAAAQYRHGPPALTWLFHVSVSSGALCSHHCGQTHVCAV